MTPAIDRLASPEIGRFWGRLSGSQAGCRITLLSWANPRCLSETGRYLSMERVRAPISRDRYRDVPMLPRWINDHLPKNFGVAANGAIKVCDYAMVSLALIWTTQCITDLAGRYKLRRVLIAWLVRLKLSGVSSALKGGQARHSLPVKREADPERAPATSNSGM